MWRYCLLEVVGKEVRKKRGWFWVAIGLFLVVMLLRVGTQGIWDGGLLVIGGLIILATGFISSSESH